MPRLPPALIRHAARIDRHLPRLLQECRDLRSASNELRWMREAVLQHNSSTKGNNNADVTGLFWSNSDTAEKLLCQYVERRARGEPLQYILGTQPFGGLEIKCRPQVLIPRGETEVYTTELASLLRRVAQKETESGLEIADVCCGSGCIGLLIHSLLRPPNEPVSLPRGEIRVKGFDVSPHALTLSRENHQHNLRFNLLDGSAASQIGFDSVDVLKLASKPMAIIGSSISPPQFDVVVSNPPYISPQHFSLGGPTSRSVRKFEPKLALVPPDAPAFPRVDQADQFYVALLRIAVATKAKLLLMEVGDTAQAMRVQDICRNAQSHLDPEYKKTHIILTETWRDDGSVAVMYKHDPAQCLSAASHPQERDDGVECRAVVVYLDQDWASSRLEDLRCSQQGRKGITSDGLGTADSVLCRTHDNH